MKIENAAPDFLTSIKDFHSIVNTKKIISINNNENNHSPNIIGYCIIFDMDLGLNVYWNYDNKEDFLKDWERIKEYLARQIVTTDNFCECEYDYSFRGEKIKVKTCNKCKNR